MEREKSGQDSSEAGKRGVIVGITSSVILALMIVLAATRPDVKDSTKTPKIPGPPSAALVSACQEAVESRIAEVCWPNSRCKPALTDKLYENAMTACKNRVGQAYERAVAQGFSDIP
jgi:hypothetical protein